MKYFIVMMLSVLLSGCAGGSFLQSNEPLPTIYTLRPAPPVENAANHPARVLEIAPVAVPPGFDRDRIALYTDGGQKLDYFAGASWSARLEDVLENVTQRSATNILPYVIAVPPGREIDVDYRLQLKVNEFQPVYDRGANEAPMLKSEIQFTLIALPDEQIISSFVLARGGRASANRLDVIAAGLEKMLQDMEAEAFASLEKFIR